MDENLYTNASKSKLSELNRFWKYNRYESIIIDGVRWEYILSKGGNKNLVLLPSGLNFGEMWFEAINQLSEEYTILAPSYPVVRGMQEALRGIYTIIQHVQMHDVAMVGMSTSGWITQCFVRAYRELVTAMVLVNTSVPDQSLIGAVKKAVERTEVDYLGHIKKGLDKFYINSSMPESDKAFYRAFLDGLLLKTSKETVLGLYHLASDYMQHYKFNTKDLKDWDGRTLIIQSDNDYDISIQNEMMRVYPNANIQILKGAGHAPVFNQPNEFIRLINDFLL